MNNNDVDINEVREAWAELSSQLERAQSRAREVGSYLMTPGGLNDADGNTLTKFEDDLSQTDVEYTLLELSRALDQAEQLASQIGKAYDANQERYRPAVNLRALRRA